MHRFARWVAVPALLLLLLVAAGWTTAGLAYPVDAQTDEPPIPTAVDAALTAVVRIETEGSFRAPFMARDAEMGGSGSGFLVSPTGLIVTNAHVVNGGTLFRVYFEGAREPLDAQLVGIAECSDVALLALEEATYPALSWSRRTVQRGLDVYAIGYPRSTEEVVVTGGKVRASNESGYEDWASVQTVIRHTADVRPGNSGGPLLDRDGAVVGVVYAEGQNNPFGYAISARDARAAIQALLDGTDADSLGINGVAFAEGTDRWGIWVLSVQPESPAARSGLRAGDIVRTLDGADVGRDSSMRAYCDVLRAQPASAVLPIEYYRPSLGEIWQGEINGRASRVTGTLTEAPYPTPTPFPTPTPSPLKNVTDASGLLSLAVPVDWEHIESTQNGFGSIVYGPRVLVTSSRRDYERGLDVPRVYVSAGQLRSPIDVHAYFDRIAEGLPCIGYDRNYVDVGEWEGTLQTTIGCGEPEPTLYNAVLYAKTDETLYLTVDVYLPVTEGMVRLEQLVAPLAATLLPAVPFWDVPQATVLVDALNVRAGPGIANERRDLVTRGERLPVAGKDGDACGWLYVNFSNLKGWVSADPQFVQLDRSCDALAVITPEMAADNEGEAQ
jgi:serine protease Do